MSKDRNRAVIYFPNGMLWAVDRARRKAGPMSRSRYVQIALREKLKRDKVLWGLIKEREEKGK